MAALVNRRGRCRLESSPAPGHFVCSPVTMSRTLRTLSTDGTEVVQFRASRVRGFALNLLLIGLGALAGMALADWLFGGTPRLTEATDGIVTAALVMASLNLLVTLFVAVFNRGDLDHEKAISFDDHRVRYQWFWRRAEIPWSELKAFRVSRIPPGTLRLARTAGRNVLIDSYYAFSEEQRHEITERLERGMRSWRTRRLLEP